LEVDLRRYDQCAEILLDFGLRQVRLISNNPAKIHALEQAGMEVIERVALKIEPHDGFANYLNTKREGWATSSTRHETFELEIRGAGANGPKATSVAESVGC
jgi:hypothetical protein